MGKPLIEEENKNGQSVNQKLDYARNWMRNYSVDPSDEEYKDIIKNAR